MLGTVRKEKIHIRDIDFRLIIYVTILSVIGVLVVHSATANEVTTSLVSTTVKQVIGVCGGLVIMTVFMLIDYHKLVKFSWIFYALAILTLLYVQIFTTAISGAKRWIHIPFFGTIQPSEFAKPALILFLSFIGYKLQEKIDRFYGILLFLLGAAPVLVLVLKEPDLSTSIILAFVVINVLFLSGVSYKWIIGVLIALIPVVVLFFVAVYQPGQKILYTLFEEHQVQRINAFFFPDEYPSLIYQQSTSVMAIGSGGLFGKGLNNSSLESVKNGSFLSEEQCDFIFAVIGEELGFVGAAVIIILISLVVIECLLIAKKCTDTVGRVIAAASGASIGIQSFINIGVACLILPNTGIPLPFLSAGLSSLLGSFIMIGLVLNVGLHGRLKRRVF